MQSNGDSMMEIFEKPELLNFLCEDPDQDDMNHSPTDIPVDGVADGDL